MRTLSRLTDPPKSCARSVHDPKHVPPLFVQPTAILNNMYFTLSDIWDKITSEPLLSECMTTRIPVISVSNECKVLWHERSAKPTIRPDESNPGEEKLLLQLWQSVWRHRGMYEQMSYRHNCWHILEHEADQQFVFSCSKHGNTKC